MNCQELRDFYELYTMGTAEEPERSEIREHLDRGCEVCMTEIKRARQLTALLGATAAEARPSAKLRRRILASVGFEQRAFGWAPFLAAATVLSLFAAVYFSGREREFANLAANLREQMRGQTMELTRLNEALAIMSNPATKVSSFGEGQPQPPKGRVFASPGQGVLLIASNLPQVPAGRILEMWLIPKSGNPVPAGLFTPASDGTAMHIQRGPVDLASTAAVAVTVENQGGSDRPTSQPFLVAELR
jgi:anti-sigma-K factor RskA